MFSYNNLINRCAYTTHAYIHGNLHCSGDSCPNGSVVQYHGHLTSGNNQDKANSEYLCLDASPGDRLDNGAEDDSAYFLYVIAHCGALPCPPYVNNTVVTCAVCSV